MADKLAELKQDFREVVEEQRQVLEAAEKAYQRIAASAVRQG